MSAAEPSGADRDEPARQYEDAIICICGSAIDDNGTIQCDRCGRWQHMRCVGVDPHDDLDELVYLCDVCQPRALDRQAARDYIEAYQREDAERREAKPRRRKKDSTKRKESATPTLEKAAGDGKRGRRANMGDGDDGDKVQPTTPLAAGLRDYSMLDKCIYRVEVGQRIQQQIDSGGVPVYPPGALPGLLATSVRLLPASQQKYGLFADRHGPPSGVIGAYLGVVDFQDLYMADPQNKFALLHGPVPQVIFVPGSGLLIDARISGNELRFLRKSCTPNCSIVPIAVGASRGTEQTWQVSIVLTETVRPGVELTLPYQWPRDTPEEFLPVQSKAALEQFAIDVAGVFGDCGCNLPPSECLVFKHLPTRQVQFADEPAEVAGEGKPRKRSHSVEAKKELVDGADSNGGRQSAEPVSRSSAEPKDDQPMTREERKIQMAIARMESSEVAPKTKRRRRVTGDEAARPQSSRRQSQRQVEAALKDETVDADKASESSGRSANLPGRPARVARLTAKRAKLIPDLKGPPRPAYIPLKRRWIDDYTLEAERQRREKEESDRQAAELAAKVKQETEAREAARLEEEAREAEIRKREMEVRRAEERQRAEEAQARAREREIWGEPGGDYRPTAQALPPHFPPQYGRPPPQPYDLPPQHQQAVQAINQTPAQAFKQEPPSYMQQYPHANDNGMHNAQAGRGFPQGPRQEAYPARDREPFRSPMSAMGPPSMPYDKINSPNATTPGYASRAPPSQGYFPFQPNTGQQPHHAPTQQQQQSHPYPMHAQSPGLGGMPPYHQQHASVNAGGGQAYPSSATAQQHGMHQLAQQHGPQQPGAADAQGYPHGLPQASAAAFQQQQMQQMQHAQASQSHPHPQSQPQQHFIQQQQQQQQPQQQQLQPQQQPAPKLGRKLSISEYMRQKKEQAALGNVVTPGGSIHPAAHDSSATAPGAAAPAGGNERPTEGPPAGAVSAYGTHNGGA